jgi:hypothetical protein
MAGHEATCWRCGAAWVTEAGPRTTLRLVSSRDAPDAAEAAAVAVRRSALA